MINFYGDLKELHDRGEFISFNPSEAKTAILDGAFTSDELRKIADVMDKLTAEVT